MKVYYYDRCRDRLIARISAIAIYLTVLISFGIILSRLYVKMPVTIEEEEEFDHSHVIVFTINPLSYTVVSHDVTRLEADILKAYDNANRSQVEAFEILKCMYNTVHVLDSSTVKRSGTNEVHTVTSLDCATRGYDTHYATSTLKMYDDVSRQYVVETKSDLYKHGIEVIGESVCTQTIFQCTAYCKWCKKSFTFTKEVKRK